MPEDNLLLRSLRSYLLLTISPHPRPSSTHLIFL